MYLYIYTPTEYCNHTINSCAKSARYARRQHSYNICKDFHSPKSIQTVRLSIPITVRSLKWIGQGVLNLQRDIRKITYNPITLEWKIEISSKSIQTIRLSIPITMWSLKWIGQGVLNLQRDIRKIAYNLMNKVP
jgi:hypothetical protein